MDCGIKENVAVSLHDCRSNKITIDSDFITFDIPDGFYIIKESIFDNNYNAKVKCHFVDKSDDTLSVYIYRLNIFGNVIKEDFTNKFISGINEGKFEYEFVYTYRSYQQILFKGYIWQDKKPYHIECEIEIRTDDITYSWINKD